MFNILLEYKQGTIPWYDDPLYPYSSHMWWVFDPRETSPKTCLTCISLQGSHFRGDEIASAFPYHQQRTVNTMRAFVHQHCRCRLIWTGRTKDVLKIPYGVLDREPERAEVPKKIELSPSQQRMFDKAAKFSRETWRNRHKRCNC